MGSHKTKFSQIMQNKQKRYFNAFTLVELIVVIVILAILATIAFLSFGSQSGAARDSTRLADINWAKKAFEMYFIWAWSYPVPDDSVDITYSWWVLWSQWTVWDDVYKIISRTMSKKVTDPLNSKEYSYSLVSNKREYQIQWDFENSLSYNFWEQANASASWTYSYISGNYNWVMVKVLTWSTYYIVPSPGLILSDPTVPTNRVYDSNFWSGKLLIAWEKWMLAKFDTTNNSIYSSWGLPTENTEILTLMQKIQNSYSWSNVATSNSSIQSIVTASTETLTSLGNWIVKNSLWWVTSTAPTSTTQTDSSWSNVVLMLHWDWANNSTGITDTSGKNTLTRNGNPVISTTQSKFWWSSVYLNWTSNLVTSTSSDNALPDVFTYEAWVYPNANWGYFMTSSAAGWPLIWYNGASWGIAHQWGWSVTSATLPTLNQWNHIAVVREWVGANQMKIYLNWIRLGTWTESWNFNASAALSIWTSWFNGYMDDIRITKWVARYTANFTVPTQAFPWDPIVTNWSCGSTNWTIIYSAPSTNLCNWWIATSVAWSGPWTWSCNGINWWTTASCNANIWDQYWNNVSLLLHWDWANSSTWFVDSTGKNTITRNGTPTISTTQNKFWWSSIYLSANSIVTNNSLNGALPDIFTVEMWVYPTTSWWYFLQSSAGAWPLIWYTGTSWWIAHQWGWSVTSTTLPTLNQWNHVAIVRSSTWTNWTKLFLNWTNIATWTEGWNFNSSAALTIWNFTWYIDDVRITSWIARYTGDFSIPSQAFPNQ